MCGTERLRQALKHVGVQVMYNVRTKYKATGVNTRVLQLDFPMWSLHDVLMKYERESDELAVRKDMRNMNLCAI